MAPKSKIRTNKSPVREVYNSSKKGLIENSKVVISNKETSSSEDEEPSQSSKKRVSSQESNDQQKWKKVTTSKKVNVLSENTNNNITLSKNIVKEVRSVIYLLLLLDGCAQTLNLRERFLLLWKLFSLQLLLMKMNVKYYSIIIYYIIFLLIMLIFLY